MRTVRATLARDLVYGAVLAFVCTGLAFVVALAGFGRLYYVSIFLPFFMLACLLVAWFLYLKDDGFIGSAQVSGSSDGKPAGGSAGARRALVWAAVLLGLLAAVLYLWAGVGSAYFIPVAS